MNTINTRGYHVPVFLQCFPRTCSASETAKGAPEQKGGMEDTVPHFFFFFRFEHIFEAAQRDVSLL